MNGFALLYFKLNFTVIHLLELLAIINAFDYKVHGTSIKITNCSVLVYQRESCRGYTIENEDQTKC
jgi:hypothetical protein